MPPKEKRARTEPPPEHTTVARTGRVPLVATFHIGSRHGDVRRCKTKAELVSAIENYHVSRPLTDELVRNPVADWKVVYRDALDAATSSLIAADPTAEALMGPGPGGAWAFFLDRPNPDDYAPDDGDFWVLELKFERDVVITEVNLEGFTFGHTRLELKAVANQGETPGFDRLIDESRCFYGPDTVAEFDLPCRNADDMPGAEVLDQRDPAQRAAFCRSVARGQMIKALSVNDSEPSVAGRHFRLRERRDQDQDRALEAKVRGGFPENLSRVIVRSRVSVAYEEVFPGAPGAASFLRDLHALQADEAFHDCVLRGATSEGSVDVSSCRFLLAARSEYFRALFFGPMATTERVVDVGEIPSAEALRGIVKFLSTGQPDRCDSFVAAVELFALAHRFSLFDLAESILYCLQDIDEMNMWGIQNLIPRASQHEANDPKFSGSAIVAALTRAGELHVEDCATPLFSVLATTDRRAVAHTDEFKAFGLRFPELATAYSRMLTQYITNKEKKEDLRRRRGWG